MSADPVMLLEDQFKEKLNSSVVEGVADLCWIYAKINLHKYSKWLGMRYSTTTLVEEFLLSEERK